MRALPPQGQSTRARVTFDNDDDGTDDYPSRREAPDPRFRASRDENIASVTSQLNDIRLALIQLTASHAVSPPSQC